MSEDNNPVPAIVEIQQRTIESFGWAKRAYDWCQLEYSVDGSKSRIVALQKELEAEKEKLKVNEKKLRKLRLGIVADMIEQGPINSDE
jgi:hypothetical protein